jgi:hypothetical protein
MFTAKQEENYNSKQQWYYRNSVCPLGVKNISDWRTNTINNAKYVGTVW